MFGFFKKMKIQEPELCTVCNKPAILSDSSKMDLFTPPGILIANEHEHPLAETPYEMYFCADCLDTISGFIVFLIEEKEKEQKHKTAMEKLSTLNVGTVLTVIEDKPHPMPNEEMKSVLENTPFSQIWRQEL